MAHSAQTAHIRKQVLGKLMITHPFHPLSGKTYDVLNVKQANGTNRYSIRCGDDILCVPESWTDRCVAKTSIDELVVSVFDARQLAELAKLIKQLNVFDS
jgi:hypothetical protein